MSKLFHVYSFPAELNPLQSQACSLLVRSSAAQLYLSALVVAAGGADETTKHHCRSLEYDRPHCPARSSSAVECLRLNTR
jgi:hypothetical protein